MLDLMRKKAGTWMVKFILGAIIIVFTFWGVGSWTAQKGNRVATVSGEPVSVESYQEAYKNYMGQLRQQFGNNLSEDLLKMLNVDQQVLDQVIEQRLLLNEARRLNFNVSKPQLIAAISAYPGFQVDGVFNQRRYELLLTNNRMTPESFEASQKKSMLIAKVRRFVTDSAKVSDIEAREWYNWRNSSVNVDYALFAPEKYSLEGPDDNQAQAYFDETKESYRTQPMVQAEYLFFDPAVQAAAVAVSQEEILDYYDEHPDEFNLPKQVRARHILFKVDPEASAEDIEKTRVRAADITRLAREGQDFAALAQEHSEGPSGPRGGDLGFFQAGAMVKPFSEAAFALQVGDISDPVKTRFGWHVIKVEEIKSASVQTPEQASAQIKKSLVETGSKTLAYDLADNVYQEADEDEFFTAAAKARGLTVVTTDFFDRSGSSNEKTKGAAFMEAAFKLAENEISDIVEADGGFYLIRVIRKKPAAVPDLALVRERVNSDWARQEREKLAMDAAGAFLETMQNPASEWARAAEAAGAEIGETGFFKKTDEIPNIGRSNQVANAAFGLSEVKPLSPAPLKNGKGIYVVRFKGRQLPDSDAFDKEKQAIKTSLLGQKKREVFAALVTDLRANNEIVIEERYKN